MTGNHKISLNLIQVVYKVVQPFHGCDFNCIIFRGLTPTVIQIKPFQGIYEANPVKRDYFE